MLEYYAVLKVSNKCMLMVKQTLKLGVVVGWSRYLTARHASDINDKEQPI